MPLVGAALVLVAGVLDFIGTDHPTAISLFILGGAAVALTLRRLPANLIRAAGGLAILASLLVHRSYLSADWSFATPFGGPNIKLLTPALYLALAGGTVLILRPRTA